MPRKLLVILSLSVYIQLYFIKNTILHKINGEIKWVNYEEKSLNLGSVSVGFYISVGDFLSSVQINPRWDSSFPEVT